MATAFDTLKFSRNLTKSGVPEQHAVAMAESLAAVMDEMRGEMVTRDYLDARFELFEERINYKLRYIGFTQAIVIGAVVLPHLRNWLV